MSDAVSSPFPEPIGPPPPRPRFDAVDVARGVALAAMAVFHGAWDLAETGIGSPSLGRSLGWQWFAHGIAASFLLLTGVSLVLAHGAAFDGERFLRRLALVAGGALLVSLGTWWLFPDAWVAFGILHHIVVASVVALPFLRLPAWATAFCGALALALPWFVALPAFDSPWLVWTGLGRRVPVTVDWVPLLPWFGCVLLGVALAPALRRLLATKPWQAAGAPARLLRLAGRHSLLVYLLHQPLIFGAAYMLAQLLPASYFAAGEPMPGFAEGCVRSCMEQGAPRAVCAAGCDCAGKAIAADAPLLAALRDSTGKEMSDSESQRIQAHFRACLR